MIFIIYKMKGDENMKNTITVNTVNTTNTVNTIPVEVLEECLYLMD